VTLSSMFHPMVNLFASATASAMCIMIDSHGEECSVHYLALTI
jgi:hypothetical protein